MKLLTLAEIEKWKANVTLNKANGFFTTNEELNSLLATARAYLELMAILNDSPTLHKDREPEDKPHAPTIKAVIEALGYIKHVDNSTGAELAIKSLEKHLE